jgi:hypothetical protein
MECSNKGWKMPDAAWFNVETREEGGGVLMDVPLAKDEVKDAVEEEHMKSISLEEKYELWLIRKE